MMLLLLAPAAATAAAAAASPAAAAAAPPPSACSPAKCDDKQCQTGTCSSGLCSYTPARDGADCTDGQVTGDAVYKSFYVSSLGQDISSPVIITAITPDFDVFVQVFPTADLVSTAQQRLDEIQATITDMKPEDAAQAMYDLLLQLTGSSGRKQQLDEAAVVQMDVRNLTSVYGQIKKGTVRRVTERRIEFLTQDDLPCLILAIDDYGKSCSSRRRSRSLLHQNLGQPHLEEVLTKGNSSASGSLKKHVQQLMLQQHDQATELPGTADHSHQQDMASASSRTSNDVHAPDSTLFPAWTLQQAQRCPTSQGSVLVLAPYLRENRCALGDEAAGYSVTFNCNDLGLCPAGLPILDDYVGWSRHAFVVASTIGDDNASGETPIILSGATLDFQNTDYILDWKSGRMVVTADGRFALRPSWFQKYQDDSATNSRTVVLLSSDRSAVASGSAQEQEVRGFPGTFWGMRGSVSYAGYTGYLSRSFPVGASPGVAMARHLLAGGTVASYPGTGAADLLTGTVFKSYAYRPGATLLDRCAANCGALRCNEGTGEVCNALTGTCDIRCDGKQDGAPCKLRGFDSTCAVGVCKDLCKSALCSATACQELLVPEGSLCPPASGVCNARTKPDGTSCDHAGTTGACSNGICARLYTIYYRVEGPVASFPSPLNSPAALTAFGAAVIRSLGLRAAYPVSRVQTVVFKIIANAQRAIASSRNNNNNSMDNIAASMGVLANSNSRSGRAIPQQAVETQVVVYRLSLPDSDLLPPEIEFNILASAPRLSLTAPFGAGLTVQRSDSTANVVNPIDYCAIRQTPCVRMRRARPAQAHTPLPTFRMARHVAATGQQPAPAAPRFVFHQQLHAPTTLVARSSLLSMVAALSLLRAVLAGYVWNNNAAVCVGAPCSNPPTSPALPTSANWNCAASGTTANGGQCSASCNPGYTASGTTFSTCSGGGWTSGANTLVCFSNGGGSSGSGACSNPPTSPALPTYANWDCPSPGTTASGGQCSASCSSGYTATGSTYGTCSGGGWTTGANTLVCTSAGGGSSGSGACSNPPTSPALPNNANWDCPSPGTTASGGNCSASCSSGYTASGNTYGTCSGGGWTTGANTLAHA
uniref:Sushi domain-containing protein n=1 Tax=Tetradesmus obliquus TaxID=3088 RepID=A0A383V799_TETOB|eukprot:jgi/Sobl393_1/19189/SZX60800.1